MPTIETARSWYPQSDPIHGFDHVLRVYYLSGQLAEAEGADLEIVRAAALLHDASGDQEQGILSASRAGHHHTSAEFAGRVLRAEGWPPERIRAVQHCIRAHRFRVDTERPVTLEAQALFDADKLDAIGAIGVGRAIAYAVKAGHPVYRKPSQRFLATGQVEEGEPHSAYHEFHFKLVKIKERLFTPTGRAMAEERHRRMVDFFEGLADEMGRRNGPPLSVEFRCVGGLLSVHIQHSPMFA
jgi:uncharacterized protein